MGHCWRSSVSSDRIRFAGCKVDSRRRMDLRGERVLDRGNAGVGRPLRLLSSLLWLLCFSHHNPAVLAVFPGIGLALRSKCFQNLSFLTTPTSTLFQPEHLSPALLLQPPTWYPFLSWFSSVCSQHGSQNDPLTTHIFLKHTSGPNIPLCKTCQWFLTYSEKAEVRVRDSDPISDCTQKPHTPPAPACSIPAVLTWLPLSTPVTAPHEGLPCPQHTFPPTHSHLLPHWVCNYLIKQACSSHTILNGMLQPPCLHSSQSSCSTSFFHIIFLICYIIYAFIMFLLSAFFSPLECKPSWAGIFVYFVCYLCPKFLE